MSRISVIWTNHNSKNHIDKVKESLNCLAKQSYTDFELIIVDDGSIDGSDKLILDFIRTEKLHNSIPVIKFVKLSRSYGFTGAVNAGYRLRNKRAEYIVIHNNDACMYSDALRIYTRIMDNNYSLGAIQGIILNAYDLSIIDSAGGYLVLYFPAIFVDFIHIRGIKLKQLLSIVYKYAGKSIPISFFEGTLPIIRVKAVKKVLGDLGEKSLFITSARFYYLEDIWLSLKLWSDGFQVMLYIEPVGYHYRSLTLKSLMGSKEFTYIIKRNYFALRAMISRSIGVLGYVADFIHIIRDFAKNFKNKSDFLEDFSAFIDGIKYARYLSMFAGRLI